MPDDSQVLLILHGREERNLEYKGPLAWNDAAVKGKICKSIMGMANIRDGGAIIIGVEEKPKRNFIPRGLEASDAQTFSQDDVASFVAEYATPFVEFTLHRVVHEEREYVVIQVEEFSELPVVCRKDGPAALRRGALYTRTRRMYETAEVSSEAEIREILELAVDKSIRTFLARAERAGLRIPRPTDADADKFRDQLRGL